MLKKRNRPRDLSPRWAMALVGWAMLGGAVGCSSDPDPPADAGPADTGSTDLGPGGDTGVDAGPPDTGTLDAGPGDTGNDTGPVDTGTDTGNTSEAGMTDAGPSPLPGTPGVFAQGPAFETALDAVPSASGNTVYFVARDGNGAPQVFRASAGSTTPSVVPVSGVSLVVPTSIAINNNDSRLFIADQAANRGVMGVGNDQGAVISVSAEGGPATVIDVGNTLRRPRALAVHGSPEQLTVVGELEDGTPAVVRVAVSGGTPTMLAMGAPLVHPTGVTVANDGTTYIADSRGFSATLGTVWRIPAGGGTPVSVYRRAIMATPTGIALSRDERRLLLSARDPETGPGYLLWVGVDGSTPSSPAVFGPMMSPLREPVGLRRARNADVFAIADDVATGSTGLSFGLVATVR